MSAPIAGLSAKELCYVRTVSLVVAEAIQELREVPEGELYANMQAHMGLATFEAILSSLESAGLIERKAHLVRYIGGKRG